MQNLTQKRIQIIDALRGLAVILMVIHHALFDVTEFLGGPAWLFTNPVFDVLHWFFAGVFIFLCGVSSRFSRSNLKRGIKTAFAAAAVSLVTWLIGQPILFGILHLLAVCMVGYGVIGAIRRARRPGAPQTKTRHGTGTQQTPIAPAHGGDVREADRGGPKTRRAAGTRDAEGGVPYGLVQPVIWIALTVVSALAVKYVAVGVDWLWVFGWTGPGFFSADYFPLFPWIFVFALGTWAGKPIRDGKLPQWFYDAKVAFFPGVGRHSFLIYLAHQPILYGITMLILGFK